MTNRVSRVGRLRRFVLILLYLTIVLAVIHQIVVRKFRNENFVSGGLSATMRPPSPYNKFIDEAGNWISYRNFRILQHVVSPLEPTFADVYSYLDDNDEWKLFFQYVPISSYHVMLAELELESKIDQNDVDLLKLEQDYLDATRLDTIVKSQKFVFVEKEGIRLDVEFLPEILNDRIRPLQKRWKQRFPSSIIEIKEKFSIQIAVQFKDLPNDELKEKIRESLLLWDRWRIDITLDPIEICSSGSFVIYEPIRP